MKDKNVTSQKNVESSNSSYVNEKYVCWLLILAQDHDSFDYASIIL